MRMSFKCLFEKIRMTLVTKNDLATEIVLFKR